jgi:hypothetical protein
MSWPDRGKFELPNMKHILLILLALIVSNNSASLCWAQENESYCSKPPKPRTNIQLEISLRDKTNLVEGQEIYLRLTFKNVSRINQEFLLDDHSEYYGIEDSPFGLFAKVWNASGKVITRRDDLCDGWFSTDCYGGRVEIVERQPGDFITLKPGETLKRIILLDDLLAKCFASPESEDLLSGKNIVQLRLDNTYSNKLEIEVKNKARQK